MRSTSTRAATSIRLGVLLYELLTGTTPFDGSGCGQAAYDEMWRIIREEEPPKPEHAIEHDRRSRCPIWRPSGRPSPASWPRLVRGELDWIVMKCLEKDRTRPLRNGQCTGPRRRALPERRAGRGLPAESELSTQKVPPSQQDPGRGRLSDSHCPAHRRGGHDVGLDPGPARARRQG